MRDNTPTTTSSEAKRPWTRPAPLASEHPTDDEYAALGAATGEWMKRGGLDAERKLFALAPEMAEAILDAQSYCIDFINGEPCEHAWCVVGHKLRAIGAKCIDGSCCDDEGCRARLGEDAHA